MPCRHLSQGSPEGTRSGTPEATGSPKSGEPSGRQVKRCMRMTRFQLGSVSTLAW